jgi:hypothetical protein
VLYQQSRSTVTFPHNHLEILLKHSTTAKPRQVSQQVLRTCKTMKQLPQEVWTEVLHHVSCPELWYACRLVSRRFHKDSNFILRTQYISQDISIISGKTYMSFSHIDTANKACFTPSEIPERNPRQAMFLRRLKDRKYRNWHNDKAPLIIMQLPRPYELPPRTHDQFQYMFPSRFLWADKSRTGVEVRSEGVSLD